MTHSEIITAEQAPASLVSAYTLIRRTSTFEARRDAEVIDATMENWATAPQEKRRTVAEALKDYMRPHP